MQTLREHGGNYGTEQKALDYSDPTPQGRACRAPRENIQLDSSPNAHGCRLPTTSQKTEKTEACSMQDSSQPLRQQGNLDMVSFKLYLPVKIKREGIGQLIPTERTSSQFLVQSLIRAASAFQRQCGSGDNITD